MNYKKVIVSSVALLMFASVGANLDNINANAHHVRTYRAHRVRKVYRTRRAKKHNRAYNS